jgi:predicted nucleic acid-binding Zn ribbon protein
LREIDPEQREQFELQQIKQRPSPYMASPIGKLIRKRMARSGLGQTQAALELAEVWRSIAGPQLSGVTQPGNLQRGVLQILTRDSSALQELHLCRRQLLADLQQALPQANIKDIRGRLV